MASTALRAVRFFGTVHAQVHAVGKEVNAYRRRGATLLTPETFPAFLATTCVTGLIVGWQIMDRIQDSSVSVLRPQGGSFDMTCTACG